MTRPDINGLLIDKLPEVLNESQKLDKVHNLLSELSRKGMEGQSSQIGDLHRWHADLRQATHVAVVPFWWCVETACPSDFYLSTTGASFDDRSISEFLLSCWPGLAIFRC